MNIRPLAFVDTSMMTASLLLRHRDKIVGGQLALTPETLKDWGSAKGLLTRIRNGAAPFNNDKPTVVKSAFILAQAPGHVSPWGKDEGLWEHHRLHVCLVQVPGAWVYSGGEAASLPVGQVTYVNHRVPHSDINVGSYTHYKLILDIERGPDPPMGTA